MTDETLVKAQEYKDSLYARRRGESLTAWIFAINADVVNFTVQDQRTWTA